MKQRFILAFWLPLAASLILLELTIPVAQVAIARLADAETNLAAFGIVLTVLFIIETPVNMLTATSTALCSDPVAYGVLCRFVISLILLLTVITAAVAFTPVFDWIVTGVMGVPGSIADAARTGMRILTLWSAAIGVRRFYQGILIRFGRTRQVSYGTVVRVLALGCAAAILVMWGGLPGIWVGSCAFLFGLLVEAAFVIWVARPTIVKNLSSHTLLLRGATTPLTTERVVRFHAPLAAAALLTALSGPLISAGLARTAFPELSLAAWSVAFSMVLFTWGFGAALQEVVIALTDGPESLEAVGRFTLNVAIGAVLLQALIAFTPLADIYLSRIAGVSSELTRFVVPGLQLAVALPGLAAFQSWLRARLMKEEATTGIYQARILNLILIAVVMALGVAFSAPGVQTAAVALTVSQLGELAYLRWRSQSIIEWRP